MLVLITVEVHPSIYFLFFIFTLTASCSGSSEVGGVAEQGAAYTRHSHTGPLSDKKHKQLLFICVLFFAVSQIFLDHSLKICH